MYDYIIIGAGSAGCVLANRLSIDPRARVLLLEAGQPDRNPLIHIPLAWTRTLKTSLDWNFTTEPQPQLKDRCLYWPRGKTLGGSSSINAMIYIRGSQRDYDNWAELGNEGWDYASLVPYFRQAEQNSRGASTYHGAGGPLHVSDLIEPNPITEAFVTAANNVGHNYRTDFNGVTQAGFGMYQVTQKDGQRCSAATAYLKPVMERPNLTVMTGAHVTNMLFQNKRVVGVAYQHHGTQHEAYAASEVILSGGAINTPQLLMLSGVGSADHLQANDIDVIVDLPGVGQNLQDHLAVGVGYYSVRPVSLEAAEKPRHLIEYLTQHKGMLTSNGSEAGGFTFYDKTEKTPDVQYHFIPKFFLNHSQSPLAGYGFTLGPLVLRPKSRGHITLRSNDPMQAPVIQPNYLSHDDDLKPLIWGIKHAREIVNDAAFDAYRGLEIMPGSEIQTDAEITNYIRDFAETLYHPVGTAKMGSDADAVVDSQLRVHGLEGLRVVDASIMPQIVSGNTNAPVIAIAEKAADMIQP